MSQLVPSTANPADWFPQNTISDDGLSIVVKEFVGGSISHVWRSVASLNSGGGASNTATVIKNPVTGLPIAPDATGAVTLPNTDEILIGTGAPTGAPPAGKEIYYDASNGKYHLANGATWTTGFGGNGALKARLIQPLVAGNNTITHNFALSAPFAVLVGVLDNTTKLWIDHSVLVESDNSIVINVGIAVVSAQITIIA